MTDFAYNVAKSAAKGAATKGIELGADYLKNKVSGLGVSKYRRIVGRKAPMRRPAKKSHSGGRLITGSALYPAGYS